MWANFHTHSTYCDGKTGLKELLDTAESMGMMSIGFSSHAPLPFEKGWAMKRTELPRYLAEVKELKSNALTAEVYAGLEIDYIPGKITMDDFRDELDYTIGSVHFVEEFPDGDPWEIDNTNVIFMDGLERIFKGDVRAAISRYFELTREMVASHRPDVVGHLDKIKIQNIGGKLYNEDELWYRQEIARLVDEIRKAGCIVEINTRGIYQKKSATTYPSPWIIKLLNANDVPVTISSDAHHPKDLVNEFSSAAKILSAAGYKKIHILHEGDWKPYRFDETGIII